MPPRPNRRGSSARRAGVDDWLQSMHQREKGWVGVIGGDLQSLSSYALTDQEIEHLTFLRGLDWPIHKKGRPWMRVPFPGDPSVGSLVIELPATLCAGTLPGVLAGDHQRRDSRAVHLAVVRRAVSLAGGAAQSLCANRPMPGVPIS